MRINHLEPSFVEEIPAELTPGVLYVSIEFRTTMHLCCCGCQSHVVLPIRPSAWRVTYDGDTISMSPSVGNWSFPCRSHYWIRKGRIDWAPAWSDERIASGRHATQAKRSGRVSPVTEPTPPIERGRLVARIGRAIAGVFHGH